MPEPLSTVALALAVCVLLAALAWAGAATRAGTAGGLRPAPALGAPLVETARLVRQRRRRTVSADLLLWRIASLGLLPTALLMLALVPLGGQALLPLGLGVVWLNALDVVVWALVWLLGWGANSVRGLVGGYRFLALALGYELPLMFALVAPAIAARSLDLAVIGAAQDGLWFVVWMPVAFATYLLGVLGFALRGPLASPAGSDAGGGVLTELSGPDRLLALAGRHALLGAGAAAAVPLFLGGGSGPLLPAAAWVVLKALALTVALSWVAARTPSLAPHRLLAPAWLVLLPLVVAQDLVVAVVAVLTTGGR